MEGLHPRGLITRLKKAFQHKLHSGADNILFECTGFCFFVFFGGGGAGAYRLYQKFVPLISCAVTFDQTFTFTPNL